MKPRAALLINALCALLLGWLYGGDALDAMRARSAEVAAYFEPPNLGFAIAALLATAVGVSATVLGLIQKRPPVWRGYRLMPIATVIVLFVDLFLLSAAKSPLSSSDRTSLTVQGLAEAATRAASPNAVPSNARDLQAMADPFGPPAYLVKGQPVKAWSVSVRQGCSGPVTEVKGDPVGTLFYCVSVDGKQAWISAVSLPVGTFFGPPQLFTRAGEGVVGAVSVKPLEDPSDPTDPFEQAADGPQTADSGR